MKKELWIAYLLAFLFGPFAAHRHYLGRHGTAILQMLLCFTGVGFIWYVIDLFLLPGMVREENLKIESYYRPVNIYLEDERIKQKYTNEYRNYNTKRTKQDIEKQILKLAKNNNGKLTVTHTAMETGLSIEEAEKYLQNMVKSGYVSMNVNDNGVIIYEFLELM